MYASTKTKDNVTDRKAKHLTIIMRAKECKLCGDECESVVHVLWECPVYDTIRNTLWES